MKFENNMLTLTDANIYIDDYNENSSTDVIIITRLTEKTLRLLTNDSHPLIYMSQDLLTLLQRLTHEEFLKLNLNNIKVLPYTYKVEISKHVSITAFNNDDDLFGSIALLIEDNENKIGYVSKFNTIGIHKKRIKTWKKIFNTNSLNTLIIGHKESSKNFLSKNGAIKNFEKDLLKKSNVTLNLTFFDPEQLIRFDSIAKKNHYQILWPEKYLNLINYFKSLNFEDSITIEQNTPSIHIIDEVQPSIDSALSMLNDLEQNYHSCTEPEFKEILNYINAKTNIIIS